MTAVASFTSPVSSRQPDSLRSSQNRIVSPNTGGWRCFPASSRPVGLPLSAGVRRDGPFLPPRPPQLLPFLHPLKLPPSWQLAASCPQGTPRAAGFADTAPPHTPKAHLDLRHKPSYSQASGPLCRVPPNDPSHRGLSGTIPASGSRQPLGTADSEQWDSMQMFSARF